MKNQIVTLIPLQAIRCETDFHQENLNRSLVLYSSCYEHFIIIDFNVEANNCTISVFSDAYGFKALLKSQPAKRIPINLLLLTLF